MKPQRIALDYDETYTADPTLWHALIQLATARGHTVTFVTARSDCRADNQDIERSASIENIPIVYCCGDQKSAHFEADIVIDDSPGFWPSIDQMRGTLMLQGLAEGGDHG